jgi:hypothetical protein
MGWGFHVRVSLKEILDKSSSTLGGFAIHSTWGPDLLTGVGIAATSQQPLGEVHALIQLAELTLERFQVAPQSLDLLGAAGLPPVNPKIGLFHAKSPHLQQAAHDDCSHGNRQSHYWDEKRNNVPIHSSPLIEAARAA